MNEDRLVPLAVTLAVVLVLAGSCSGSDSGTRSQGTATSAATTPQTAPNVRGVLLASEADTPDAYRLGEVSDTYYERMDVQLAEGVSITSPEGRRLSPSDVSVGTTVDVWIEGGCEESFPVQCEVTAVQVVAG